MPRKPKYINPDQTIEDFYASVSDAYNSPGEGEQSRDGKKKQELLAEEFGISRIKVRKILITTGDLTYPETRLIQELLASDKKMEEICEILKMAPSTVNSLLPHNLDVVVGDDEEMYKALLCLKAEEQNTGDHNNLQNAVRLYYEYRNGLKFPKLKEYERMTGR